MMNTKPTSRTASSISGALFALVSLTASADAQVIAFPLGGAPFNEAWVDPTSGGGGAVNNPASPYATLNSAIQALAAAGGPGIVHAGLGIYSPSTNGETLPVVMATGITVQGINSRGCVIRGLQSQRNLNCFVPLTAGSDACETGTRQFAEVLVDFTTASGDSRLDSFTMQGGDIQVYAETEGSATIAGAVSNCVFDMLDQSDAGVNGPDFGVLLVHVYDYDAATGEGVYHDIPMSFLNDTFVQGMATGAAQAVQATLASTLDAVAICDVVDPLRTGPGSIHPDPDQALRGVGNPSIQNCLFRSLPVLPRMAMLGINDQAVSVGIGSVVGPSNGFDPALVGASSIGSKYCSQVIGALPVPVISTNPLAGGRDPSFAGEFLARTADLNGDGSVNTADQAAFGALASPYAHFRDWRLLPTSPMRDLGSLPRGGILAAANGTSFVEAPGMAAISPFDFDGDGYGNPRVDRNKRIDLGADESDALISLGAANDSLCDAATVWPYPAAMMPSLQRFACATRQAAQVSACIVPATLPAGPFGGVGSFTILPTLANPANLLRAYAMGSQTEWIASRTLTVGFTPKTANYVAPYEAQVAISRVSSAVIAMPADLTGMAFVSTQLSYRLPNGQKALSNSQTSLR